MTPGPAVEAVSRYSHPFTHHRANHVALSSRTRLKTPTAAPTTAPGRIPGSLPRLVQNPTASAASLRGSNRPDWRSIAQVIPVPQSVPATSSPSSRGSVRGPAGLSFATMVNCEPTTRLLELVAKAVRGGDAEKPAEAPDETKDELTAPR